MELINEDAVVGHNAAPLDILLAQVQALQTPYVQGETSLGDFGILVIHAAVDETIKPDTTMARRLYGLYSATEPDDVAKSDASKLRQLIRLGANPNGADVADRVVRFHRDIPRGKSKPLYTAMVVAARLQLKAPKKALTDDQILAATIKAVPVKALAGEKSSNRLLDAAIKDVRLLARAEDWEGLNAIRELIDWLMSESSKEIQAAEPA